MTVGGARDELHGYLRDARDTLRWKLEGLGEYDIRRPMTPTGTNLLGLVKHSAGTHVRYFCDLFGAADVHLPWRNSGEPNADFWATEDEETSALLAICDAAWAAADVTIASLPLDATSAVPWWGGEEITLHHALVHVTADTQRHAGHADILRELVDGAAGLLRAHDNLASHDPAWWARHRDRVERAARTAAER